MHGCKSPPFTVLNAIMCDILVIFDVLLFLLFIFSTVCILTSLKHDFKWKYSYYFKVKKAELFSHWFCFVRSILAHFSLGFCFRAWFLDEAMVCWFSAHCTCFTKVQIMHQYFVLHHPYNYHRANMSVCVRFL